MHRLLQYILPLLLLFSVGTLNGQTLSLYDIDASGYPVIRAKLLALDAEGNPYSPDINKLELYEDGVRRTIRSVNCPPPKEIVPISSVLTIDISSSMREFADRNINIARGAARAWIDAMPLGISECAITSFNENSFLNQDFTIDAQRLRVAVDELQPGGGTSYDAALISPVIGAIPVALGGKHKRVIVFLTDGQAGGMQNEIIRQANAGDITIHCVTVGFPAPKILKEIARRTGGLWFENVTTPEEGTEIYRMLLGQSQGGEPCEIEWESGPTCDPLRQVTLRDPSLPAETSTTYDAPMQGIADLTIDKSELYFGVVSSGSTVDDRITLSTGSAPVRVLSITSSDPRIKAIANNAPPAYTIPPNADYDVIFRFEPTDSSLVVAEITIEIDGCRKTFLASGGTWRNGSAPPDIRLVVPNGGERFPVGSNTDIHWTGVLPSDTVRLDYSTDAGRTWNLVADKATGLSYPWIVPNTPSETCLARVTVVDTTGSAGGEGGLMRVRRLYTQEDHLSYGPISAARFSYDGKYIATATENLTDRIRIIKTLDGSLWQNLTPEGGVVDLEFSDDGKLLAAALGNRQWVIFPLVSGSIIRQPTSTDPTAVALSKPGGAIIGIGDAAGSVALYNGTTGAFIRSFATGIGSIASIDFNPSSTEIVVVGNNDSIKFFNLNGSPASPATLPNLVGAKTHTPGLGITSARYSRDGNRIVSAGNGGDAYTWDRYGGRWKDSIAGHNDGAFSPDGTLILTGDGDVFWSGGNTPGIPKLWDAATGNKVGELKGGTDGHTKAVTSVDITELNGIYYAVTAGLDKKAIVWEISPNDSAKGTGSDVSDALWAIVDAELEAVAVDFGEVLVGSAKDSTLVAYIRNTGGITVDIEEMQITGGNAAAFDIISGIPPFSIPPGEAREVELRFTPGTVGPHNTTLEIRSAFDTLRPALLGEGIAPQLRIDAGIVDFGQVEVGSWKDSLVQVVVTNIGTAPLTITSTQQNGPDMASFSILSGEAPFTLPAGASQPMSLRFTPATSGRTSGTILFGFNGPGSPAVVTLFGRGFCPTTISRARAEAGSVSGAPGDTVSLPFTIVPLDPPAPSPPGTPSPGPLGFTAYFTFNNTLLTPVEKNAITEEGPTERTAAWQGEWNPLDSSITWRNGVPRFIAALGNEESTPVAIGKIEWNRGCPPDVAKLNGTFTLTELCRDGGTRLFSADGSLKLVGAAPNPVLSETAIRFALIEEGETRLYLINMRGERAATLVDGPMIPGSYTATFNASELESGTYLIVLETPTAQLSERLIVRE